MADETVMSSMNPWSNDDRSLGSIRNVLLLAEKTGHLALHNRNQGKSKLSPGGRTGSQPSKQCPSLRMINCLRDIEEKRRAIDKATYEIHCRMQDRETKDLTHLQHIEKRIQVVTKLNNHLQSVISRKDELIQRLQQPYNGDFIKIEASYKQYASEVFPQLVPLLSELSAQLDNITWASNVDIFNTQLNTLLDDISALVGSLQSSFVSMNQMRQTIHQLHSHRVKEEHDLDT